MFQIQMNEVIGIKMSWVEFFSKVNKRFGTFIPDSRVRGQISLKTFLRF